MTAKCKAFIEFYRGCGFSDSATIFELLKDLPKEDQPNSAEKIRQYLLTLPKPLPIMELNNGEIT
jgi:hypothetical protein